MQIISKNLLTFCNIKNLLGIIEIEMHVVS
jgi:hypothetical protein